MRKTFLFLFFVIQHLLAFGQVFNFSYEGPDTLYVNENCEAILDWGHPDQPQVSSNVGANIDSFYIYNISDGYEVNEAVPPGSYTISYRAVDDVGNADIFSFSIVVADTIPPTLIQAVNTTVSCSFQNIAALLQTWYNSNGNITASDNCGLVIVPDLDLNEVIDQFNMSVSSNCGNTRSVTVHFTIADPSGNALPPVAVTFETVDLEDPVFVTLPQVLNTSCTEDVDQILENWIDNLGGASATDNCSDTLIWEILWSDNANNSGKDFVGQKPYQLQVNREKCTYVVNLNFIVSDGCGNKKSSFTTVTITDDNDPVFSEYPSDTTVNIHEIPPVPEITAIDPCKGELIVLFEAYSNQHPDPAVPGHYNYSIEQIWTADDGCDHSIMHIRDMEVIDTIAPVFTVPPTITVSCLNLGDTSETGVPTDVSDNSDSPVEIYFEDTVNGSGCAYSVERIWFASDITGNTRSAIQIINVVDDEPPVVNADPQDMIMYCNETEAIGTRFFNWISAKGGADITDACSEVNWFAAEPGSYDLTDQQTYPGLYPGMDFFNTCIGQDSVMYQKEVDFVFYDACGNYIRYTKKFKVLDDEAPVFSDCPADTVLTLATDECQIAYMISGIAATDSCESPVLLQEITQIFPISSQLPGDLVLPVDTTTIQIGPFILSNLDINEILELKLVFNNMDANDPNEYFVIRGEDGSILDTTLIIDEECGDFEMDMKDLIDAQLLQIWLQDGFLTLVLEPKITTSGGAFSINDICTNGSFVEVTLNFDLNISHSLNYSLSVGQSLNIPFGPDQSMEVLLNQGNHPVTFKVSDCAGNEGICIQNILVEDLQAPVMDCPEPIHLVLSGDTCRMEVTLPDMVEYMDNCLPGKQHIYQQPENVADALLQFTFNEESGKFEARDKNFIFNEIPTDIFARNPRVTVFHQAKTDAGSFFEIADEAGNVLGITEPGSCDSVTATIFDLDENLFHQYKNDGSLSFTARAVPANPMFPCDPAVPQTDGDHDGISAIYLAVYFEQIDLAFYTTGATETELTGFTGNQRPLSIPMNGGISTVWYILNDLSGNADTCSFEVIIEDTIPPVAVCKEATGIFIHPSGVVDYELKPEEIDGGSFDNCLIDSMSVNPKIFDCSLAGTTVDVTLYVFDAFNLVDSCQTSVKIETQALQPTYSSGVCANDTLQLFANLPDAPANVYTILWTGPSGFNSDMENPARPDANTSYSGTYKLEVTGVNGCASEGFVEVYVEDLSIPPMSFSKDTLCEGEHVTLTSTTYSGNVTYFWFSGTAPAGQLLDTTDVPSLTLTPPVGTSQYYVIVESTNCISLPSETRDLLVLEQPQASVNDPFIKLCEGDNLALGTNVSGTNFQYLWTGPDAYTNTNQNPPVIPDVRLVKQGRYFLVISNGSCRDTASAEVVIDARPTKPFVSADSLYCEGEPIVFVVNNIVDADAYHWYLNDQLYTVKNTNSWVIPAASDQLDGTWKVAAKVGDCFSEFSEPIRIRTELAFPVTATSNSPVCQGDSVLLFAPLITGAQYLWIDPNNNSYTEMNLKIPAVKGTYRLEITTAAGCLLTSSTDVDVINLPLITALSNTGEDCMTSDECIELVPTVFPPDDTYIYQWSGPGGFTSDEPNPVICNPDPSINGTYTLVVLKEMCPSIPVKTIIDINIVPETPVLEGTQSVCEFDTLVLTVQNYEAGGPFTYFWSSPDQSQYQTTRPELKIPGAVLSNSGLYTVSVFNGDCYSEVSQSFSVEVIKKPNQPAIWGEDTYCEGDAIRLFTQYSQQTKYYWEGPDGFMSSLQNPVIFPAVPDQSGVYRLRIEVNGCYSDYSEGLVLQVNPKPQAPQITGNTEPFCIGPDTKPLELCLTNIKPATKYYWYHNQTGKIIKESFDPCVNIDEFGEFADGLNGFYVVAEAKGCLSEPSELIHVYTSIMPLLTADAGEDIFACDDTDLNLSASIQQGGIWSTTVSGVNIATSFNPYTKVTGLSEGYTAFVWSLSYGVCQNYSRDTMSVYIAETPDANDDLYQTEYNTSLSFSPAENDGNHSDATVFFEQTEYPEGTIWQTGNNTFRFTPSVYFIGKMTVPYRLIHNECPEKYSMATITFEVGDITDCFGMNVITPNGDGINDILVFPCLSTPLYPRNRLIVFNQWGDEVYTASPYLNDWQGTYKDKDLPVGTYYYMLDLGNDTQAIRDFVVIER